MGDEGPTTSGATDPLRAVELLGRETPAGKALFRLYNGSEVGRQKGQLHHERNKRIFERKVASGWVPGMPEPSPPKPVKPTVAVPSFGHKKWDSEGQPKYIPHRKPGHLIKAEMQHDMAQERNSRPVPRGPLLDSAEKDRCSKLMEFRGKPPAEPSAPPKKVVKSERQELQELFDAVLEEVEERRQFLRDMEKAGALKQEHVFQIRTEITERVQEMAKLDRMLKELDLGRASSR